MTITEERAVVVVVVCRTWTVAVGILIFINVWIYGQKEFNEKKLINSFNGYLKIKQTNKQKSNGRIIRSKMLMNAVDDCDFDCEWMNGHRNSYKDFPFLF